MSAENTEQSMRDLELIDGYFTNTLSESQLNEVDMRLANDSEFRNLFREHQQITKAIGRSHLHEKLAELRSLEARLQQRATPMQRIIYWAPVSMAASLVVLVGLWLFLSKNATIDNKQLFQAYYVPFNSPGSGLTRSDLNTATTSKMLAYEMYDNGQYQKAIEYIKRALQEQENPVLELCLGNCYLTTGNLSTAEVVFQEIISDHAELKIQAKWYLALTYLKAEQPEKAKSLLLEINKSKVYGKQAAQLLKQLD